MTMLLAAAAAFLGIHLIVSGTKLRDATVRALGENTYLAIFSLASLGLIVWLVIAYNSVSGGSAGTDAVLYVAPDAVRHLAIPVVFIAFLIGIPGLLTRNPTSVRQESAAAKEETVRGILRVTRHPFLWGVAIWSAFHLAANGDEASTVFFGAFFLVAVLGTFSIDAKRRRALGPAWTDFASRTSNLPFGAIAAGRNRFVAREIFDWRFAAAILVFAAVLFSHARLFGLSPFPTGWRPF
ncbi:MAG: NnrU family protein [Alphaproteobacteria bacterium]|nr:NnrU family protein [Alphaproteobacteria bacterium]